MEATLGLLSVVPCLGEPGERIQPSQPGKDNYNFFV